MGPEVFKDLGAVGILGFGFFFLLKWMLGKFTSELVNIKTSVDVQTTATTTVLTDALNKIASVQQASGLMLAFLSRCILVHDATSRGIDPSTGMDQTDRDRQAVVIYQKLLDALEELKTTMMINLSK